MRRRMLLSAMVCAVLLAFVCAGVYVVALDRKPNARGLFSSGKSAAPTEPAPAQTSPMGPPLTYWRGLHPEKVAPLFDDLGNTKVYRELIRRTGIAVAFIHPPWGGKRKASDCWPSWPKRPSTWTA